MAFDTSNDYSEFDNVGSGESGTIEGLLPIEGSASAFRYRKVIQIVVTGTFEGSFGAQVKGNWLVRVRENGFRGGDGAYVGAILFEQEVFFTADITVVPMGPGLNLVTWKPLGPAGSGEHRTSICNGEECAIVENVYDPKPGEIEAYGANGAWRFRDSSINTGNMTPRQKYEFERGFSDWEDEGVATSGSYIFFAEWQSSDFLSDFPEGAILETVYDRWQTGQLDTEALYTFSYKPGEELFDAVSDAWTGQKWWIYKGNGAMRCARTRCGDGSYKISDEDPVVLAGAFGSLRAMQHGHTLLVLHQMGSGVGLRFSISDGREWYSMNNMIENVKQIDAVGDTDGGEIIVLGIAKVAIEGIPSGSLVRVVLTTTDENGEDGFPLRWKQKEINQIAAVGDTVLPTKPKGRLTRDGGNLDWIVQDSNDVQVYRSTDNGRSFGLAASTE